MIPFDIGDPANPNSPYSQQVPVTLPGSTAKLLALNDTPYQILLQFSGSNGGKLKVPSGWARIFPVAANAQQVNWTIDKSLAPATAVISDLTLEAYQLGEDLPDQYPILRQISVGNSLVTNTSAANALEQDLATPFVLTGLVASKDVSIANQLDVTSGIAFLRQPDQSLGRVAPLASLPGQFLTSALSATYFLDLNPDGSWSFATSHSIVTNFMTLAQVQTDGAGNISTVTTVRPVLITLLPAMAGPLKILATFIAQAASSPIQAFLSSAPVSDTPAIFAAVNGDSTHRIQQYIRGSDGYGGLSGGPGGATPVTAHLYAQAAGWQIDEALAVLGALSTQGTLTAKGASSLDNGALTTNGSGALSKIGSQASAGSFGAPVIVAQASSVHVTLTTLQTILSFTPSSAGTYRVSGTFAYTNPVQQKPQFSVLWTDTDLNLPTVGDFFALSSNSAGELMSNGQATVMGNNQVVACAPMVFNAKAGVAIQVQFQDGGGTPSDFVSAIIERLA